MTEQDPKIVSFLLNAAPPERDPVFRLRVLEGREKRMFRRRLFTMSAGLILIGLVAAFGVGIGGGAPVIKGLLTVAAAFCSAWLAFRGHLRQILRRSSL